MNFTNRLHLEVVKRREVFSNRVAWIFNLIARCISKYYFNFNLPWKIDEEILATWWMFLWGDEWIDEGWQLDWEIENWGFDWLLGRLKDESSNLLDLNL
jgi:hypothetical protein